MWMWRSPNRGCRVGTETRQGSTLVSVEALLDEGSAATSWADTLSTWPTAKQLARMLEMVTAAAFLVTAVVFLEMVIFTPLLLLMWALNIDIGIGNQR